MPRESLQDYVRRIIREKNLSHVKVSERSKKLGKKLGLGISPAVVNTIIQGTVDSPKVSTLQGLALGLGEPEDLIFELARGKQISTTGEWAAIQFEHDQLSESDKKELRPTIEMLKREIHLRLKTD